MSNIKIFCSEAVLIKVRFREPLEENGREEWIECEVEQQDHKG